MTDLYDYFVTQTRDNGETFVSLREDRPDWLYEAVREAHDEEFPNDWRYEMCRRICGAIDEGALVDEDGISEFADSAVDVYNKDRLDWLAENLTRVNYVDEAVNEFAMDGGILTQIGWGQYRCIEQMAQVILSAWLENKDNDEEEEGE